MLHARSFSKLKLIKNYLRSTIGQEQLANLSIISIEYNIVKNINYDFTKVQFLNNLKLNFSKTNYVFYSLRFTSPKDIYISQHKISRLYSKSDLGVIFDDKLSFDYHFIALVKKLRIRQGILYRNIKYVKSVHRRILLFYAFIISIIDYGIVIWSSLAKTKLIYLNSILQNIKNIFFKHFIYPFHNISITLKNMNIGHRILYHDFKLLYRYLRNNMDDVDLLLKIPDTRLRYKSILTCGYVRLNITRRSFPFRLIRELQFIDFDLFNIHHFKFNSFLKQNIHMFTYML